MQKFDYYQPESLERSVRIDGETQGECQVYCRWYRYHLAYQTGCYRGKCLDFPQGDRIIGGY